MALKNMFAVGDLGEANWSQLIPKGVAYNRELTAEKYNKIWLRKTHFIRLISSVTDSAYHRHIWSNDKADQLIEIFRDVFRLFYA